MKFRVRKIDPEIKEEIQLFRSYTQHTIEQIIKFVWDNPSDEQFEGLIAKLLRQK